MNFNKTATATEDKTSFRWVLFTDLLLHFGIKFRSVQIPKNAEQNTKIYDRPIRERISLYVQFSPPVEQRQNGNPASVYTTQSKVFNNFHHN